MSKVLGFVGIESYDLVHLLGQTITKLGRAVIIVDCSEFGDFVSTVPYGVDDGCVVEYCDMTIARGIALDEIITDDTDEYDYAIIYFGSSIKHPDIELCEEVYLVTDFQKHNINRLLQVVLDNEQCRFLIYRNRVSTKIDITYVINTLKSLEVDEDTTYVLDDEQEDYDNMVMLQYDSVLNGVSISSGIKDFIVDVLKVDFTQKMIQGAIKKLNRRK